MRFVDFLRTTVLLSAGAATALATVTVFAAAADAQNVLVAVSIGFRLIATSGTQRYFAEKGVKVN